MKWTVRFGQRSRHLQRQLHLGTATAHIIHIGVSAWHNSTGLVSDCEKNLWFRHTHTGLLCSTAQFRLLAGQIQQAKRCCYIASSSWAPGPCCGQRRLSTRAQKNYLNGNKWEIMKKQFLCLMANRLLSVWLRKRDCNITPMSLERHGSFYLSLGVTLTWHIPCSCCLRSQLKLTCWQCVLIHQGYQSYTSRLTHLTCGRKRQFHGSSTPLVLLVGAKPRMEAPFLAGMLMLLETGGMSLLGGF